MHSQQVAGEAARQQQEQRFVGYRIYLVLLISLSIVFDGFDGYTLGLAIPSIAREWGLKPGAFATATALVTVFTLLGSMLAGFAGDRIGRKRALIASTLLYAAGSLIAAFAPNMMTLAISRAVVGIGLGGALVTAVVSVAEHAPPRQRSLAITLTTLGIALGHALAGATASLVLEPFGWRSLFLIGALVPGGIALIHTLLLPETPSFMYGKPQYREALAKYCRRIDVPPERFASGQVAEPTTSGTRFGALFTPTYRADTVLLWVGIAASLFVTYSLSQWLPSLISRTGASPSLASQAVVFLGIGQIAGGLISVPVVYWFGSRWPMRLSSIVLLILALTLALQFDARPTTLLTYAAFAALACAIAVIIQLYHTLGPAIYPEEIRSTGTGFALAIGRLGAVLSAYTGARALEHGGPTFFGIVAIAAVVQFVSFGFIKRHATSGRRR